MKNKLLNFTVIFASALLNLAKLFLVLTFLNKLSSDLDPDPDPWKTFGILNMMLLHRLQYSMFILPKTAEMWWSSG